jgi:hypothetical protein
LRIIHAKLPDGRRACGARFSFRGEVLDVEAIESGDVDPDDAIVRRCAWLLYRRIGIRLPVDTARVSELERQVIEAAMRGDTALADKLGLELALLNDSSG